MTQKNRSFDPSLSGWNIQALDLWKFARAGAQANGELSLTLLPRLLQAVLPLPENIPAFRWTAAGEMRTESAPAGDTVHAPYLKLTLSGALQLECQRCLAPYLHSLSIQMLYRIVETEQQADAAPLDNDQIEIIVGTRAFDLLDLMDQELYLALPSAPKHPVCPALPDALRISRLPHRSPFAMLAALKQHDR
ncbi:YceD family protein [Candidatus Glomeribacter gigasporarum]|uniref:YceD family protein n=1 Tax=Candidatus Glomeribacter gigasporarum TaxID=132144 RepID=UPI000314D92E|nr:YceD family protein [Candidatus Glomeribacter gigasporarum]